MEELKNIEKCLISFIQAQCSDLRRVDAKELGEVIDAVKDLEEARYYCSITEAMEKSAEEKESGGMMVNYYMEPMYYRGQPRDGMGRYMSGGSQDNSDMGQSSSGTRNYVPYMEYAPYMMRDDRWRDEHLGDRSGMSRRMYMESKQMRGDGQQSMKELEHYIKDLGDDLTDMIKESSQEEKQVLSSKLSQLATKIK